MMIQIFGEDIEISAYSKLYRGLSDDSINSPEITVTQIPSGIGKAGYSNKRKTILVWEYFIDKAIDHNDTRGELMAALLEEYGHHIDNLLRNDFTSSPKKDEDLRDEGAKFAYSLFYFDIFNENKLNFASVETPNYKGDLEIDFSEIHTPIKEYVNQNRWKHTSQPIDNDIENFGFGFKEGTHGGIEFEVLPTIGYTVDEIFKLYYGNWLRDVSQVIVAPSVRLTKESQQALKKVQNPRIQQLLQNMPNKISHQGWVELIELFAAYEFVYNRNYKEGTLHYENHLQLFRKKFGTLTKDILGIYRPEEHIDNPKGLTDDSAIDVSFQYEKALGVFETKKLYAGESSATLGINKYNQKNYIWVEKNQKDPLRPTSDDYMTEQLNLAIAKGRNTEGLRHLGAAFHVLEDYFAHSNFVELSLIKVGFKNVYPWVEGMQGKNYKSIPLVTGKFLLDDTLASLLPKIGDLMLPVGFTEYKNRKPGERTFQEAFILTALRDLSKGQAEDGAKSNPEYVGLEIAEWLTLYEKYLDFLDYKAVLVNSPYGFLYRLIDRGFHTIGDLTSTFQNVTWNLLFSTVDDDIKMEQTQHSNKHYGSDPTHTQLAKDDHHHPLNGLAATLAKMAIKDVAEKMKLKWNGDTSFNLTEYVLNKYSQHPMHVDWMDNVIKDWSKSNTNTIKWLESPTPIEHTHKIAERVISNKKIQELIDFFK